METSNAWVFDKIRTRETLTVQLVWLEAVFDRIRTGETSTVQLVWLEAVLDRIQTRETNDRTVGLP